jgi:hypothetical protein
VLSITTFKREIIGRKTILENPLLNYLDWLFRIILYDGELRVKSVSYCILFTTRQEIIQVVEETPMKKAIGV